MIRPFEIVFRLIVAFIVRSQEEIGKEFGYEGKKEQIERKLLNLACKLVSFLRMVLYFFL